MIGVGWVRTKTGKSESQPAWPVETEGEDGSLDKGSGTGTKSTTTEPLRGLYFVLQYLTLSL